MMTYKIRIPPPVEKELTHTHPSLKVKIKAALDDLSLDPTQGKPLKEELKGYHSYRVNRYRIVYQIHTKSREVLVVAIGHRGSVYQLVKK